MPVPTTIADLNVTASLNSPAGSEAIGTSLDDYIRAHGAIIKQHEADLAATTGGKGADLVANAVRRVATVAALKALTAPTISTVVFVENYYAGLVGGGGAFYWDSSSAAADDGGLVLIPDSAPATGRWKRQIDSTLLRSKDFGAKHDGATDDRAALNNANTAAAGKWLLIENGSAAVATNLTFGATVGLFFAPGAKLKPAASVTVTINGFMFAGTAQVFDVAAASSAIAGLKEVNVGWFAGDKLNTANDARAEIQKAYDACETSGTVNWPFGYFSGTMTSPITVSKGQKTKGAGPLGSELRFLTTVANGFSVTTTANSEFDGLSFVMTSAVIPTSGKAIQVAAANTRIRNLYLRSGYTGVSFETGSSGSRMHEFDLTDCLNAGVICQSTTDIYLSKFIITAPTDWFAITPISGTFVAGETVTGGTSGATATGLVVVSSTLLKGAVTSKNFTLPETITGGTSGATATITAQTIPHQLGGLRLADQTEAIIVSDGDIHGGVFSMTTDAAVNSPGVRPAYNRFSNVFFDNADNGANYDKSVDFDFDSCWWSNRPNNGLSLSAVSHFRFKGGGAINCAKRGALVNAGASNVFFNGGFAATGNSTELANTYDGVEIAAGVSDFVVQGCRLGATLGFGTQRYGLNINTGASDRYIAADNLVSGNGTGGVIDGGTGVNKRVANNY